MAALSALPEHCLIVLAIIFDSKIETLSFNGRLRNSSIELKLLGYDWPVNVRELENVMQRAVLLAQKGMISPGSLGFLKEKKDQDQTSNFQSMKEFVNRPLKESVSIFEAKMIASTIKHCSGKADSAAKQLGLSKTTFYDKMKRYGINPKNL